jgi:hypothetical protein
VTPADSAPACVCVCLCVYVSRAASRECVPVSVSLSGRAYLRLLPLEQVGEWVFSGKRWKVVGTRCEKVVRTRCPERAERFGDFVGMDFLGLPLRRASPLGTPHGVLETDALPPLAAVSPQPTRKRACCSRTGERGWGECARVLTVALKTGECTQVDNSWGDKTHTFGGGGTYQSPLHHTHAKLPTHSGKTDIHMQHRATAAPVIEGMHVEHAET